jgi:voltage-gated potassium channel Kch
VSAGLIILTVFFGSLMFYCEGGEWSTAENTFVRPSVDGTMSEPTPFLSIAHAFYYCIVTLTTTGYGDFVPTSLPGRILSAGIMVCGVLMIALPISVIGEAHATWCQRNVPRNPLCV